MSSAGGKQSNGRRGGNGKGKRLVGRRSGRRGCGRLLVSAPSETDEERSGAAMGCGGFRRGDSEAKRTCSFERCVWKRRRWHGGVGSGSFPGRRGKGVEVEDGTDGASTRWSLVNAHLQFNVPRSRSRRYCQGLSSSCLATKGLARKILSLSRSYIYIYVKRVSLEIRYRTRCPSVSRRNERFRGGDF